MDLILTPAYGRDYKSKKAVLDDYNNGKDFCLMPQGCYIGKADITDETVKFRYDKLRKIMYLGET